MLRECFIYCFCCCFSTFLSLFCPWRSLALHLFHSRALFILFLVMLCLCFLSSFVCGCCWFSLGPGCSFVIFRSFFHSPLIYFNLFTCAGNGSVFLFYFWWLAPGFSRVIPLFTIFVESESALSREVIAGVVPLFWFCYPGPEVCPGQYQHRYLYNRGSFGFLSHRALCPAFLHGVYLFPGTSSPILVCFPFC